MVRQIPVPPTDNKGFIDSFLEFGIAYYYTIAKILAAGISETSSPQELRSIALEHQVLASTAFELLITWYYALQQFTKKGNSRLLVDILLKIRIGDKKRIAALKLVEDSTMVEFGNAFNIPIDADELNNRGIDPEKMLEALSAAKRNLTKLLLSMRPSGLIQSGKVNPRPWMNHLLIRIKHGFLVVAQELEGVPGVTILTEGSARIREDGANALFSTDAGPESCEMMLSVIGNMAIALRSLIHVVYSCSFNDYAISPAVDRIVEDIYSDTHHVG